MYSEPTVIHYRASRSGGSELLCARVRACTSCFMHRPDSASPPASRPTTVAAAVSPQTAGNVDEEIYPATHPQSHYAGAGRDF